MSPESYKKKTYSVYQPIVEIASSRIAGYEALTRCLEKGLRPDILFREAYQKGNAVELDLICMRNAFEVLPRLKLDQVLFVNVEPVTFYQCFVEGKAGDDLLRKTVSHHSRIIFELTEGVKSRDIEGLRSSVHFLRKTHCRFALDDIADAGPKFQHLLTLEPDFVKIDMSLIQNIANDDLLKHRLGELMAIALEKNITLVAEGIERKEDLEYLKKIRIPYAQGFYFAKPEKEPEGLA